MPLKVNLNKSAETLRVSLQKAGVSPSVRADIAFNMDVSGSYEDEHRDGSTQHLVERLVPWGMVFDPNQQIDFLTFSSGRNSAYHLGVITPATTEDYIQRNVIGKVPGWCGGTEYSYVIEKDLQLFGWLGQEAAPVKKPGFFSRLTGSATAAPAAVAEKKRSIVLFNTDGGNDDEDRTYKVLQDSERRGDGVYFLFLAYANGGARFDFLEKIGDKFANTGLVKIPDLNKFLALDDDAMNQLLLGDELLTWLKK